MQNCQPIREHQFEFANLENEACQNDGAEQATSEQAKRRPQILTEINYY